MAHRPLLDGRLLLSTVSATAALLVGAAPAAAAPVRPPVLNFDRCTAEQKDGFNAPRRAECHLTTTWAQDPARRDQASGAVAMARHLDRARLLTVEGYGHGVLINPSSCANDYVSEYVIRGPLPPKRTRCSQDRQPFSPVP